MTRKQRRLVLIGSSLGVLALAAVLVLSALKDSIVFFNSPTDVVEKTCARHPHPARRAGQARHAAARRQACGALRGDRRQDAPSRSAIRASCRTCSAKGRA